MLEIWNYIAGDNERAADHFIDLLIHHFRLLGEVPYAGRGATSYAPLSQLSCQGVLIFYLVQRPGVRSCNWCMARELKHYPF